MLGAQHLPVLAKQSTDTFSIGVQNLQELVINEKSPDVFQPLLEPVIVLTQKEIEQAAVQNLQDLFHYIQGVDLRSRGQEGVSRPQY